MYKRLFQLAVPIAFVVLLASCGGVKKAKQDMLILKEGTLDTLPNFSVPIKEANIQKDDILSIVVYSDNPEATAIYNQPYIGAASKPSTGDAASTSKVSGYLVDQGGNIRMHGLGFIHAEGLTRHMLMDTISSRLKEYLTNPYADVRFMNNRITVLGEVSKPGVYSLPAEKITILEIIGMAGDLTIYGKRENVLVIREQNGRREFGRLDLRRSDIFQSPYFYLQQNDMVVIEPNAKKPTATEQENIRKLSLVATFATLVSTVSILITLFR